MNYLCLFLVFAAIISVVSGQNWATYPSVPKTASINGFADPIYTKLPDCAQDCVEINTDNTPCPYWDTGCFCVMPQWAGQVGECFASKCSGKDVSSATSLAVWLCSGVGANQWLMPGSISTALSSAANLKKAKDLSTVSSNSASLTDSSSKSSSTKKLRTSSETSSGTSSAASSMENDARIISVNEVPRVAFIMFMISLVL